MTPVDNDTETDSYSISWICT